MPHNKLCHIIILLSCLNLAYELPTAYAGSCDCQPEIKNATAIVTSECAKIWSAGECKLKETGTSGRGDTESEKIWRENINKGLESAGITYIVGNRENYYPKISDIDFFHGHIVDTLANEVPYEFALDAIKLAHENQDVILESWSSPKVQLISGKDIRGAVGDHCFYVVSDSYESSFYINSGENKECAAAMQY